MTQSHASSNPNGTKDTASAPCASLDNVEATREKSDYGCIDPRLVSTAGLPPHLFDPQEDEHWYSEAKPSNTNEHESNSMDPKAYREKLEAMERRHRDRMAALTTEKCWPIHDTQQDPLQSNLLGRDSWSTINATSETTTPHQEWWSADPVSHATGTKGETANGGNLSMADRSGLCYRVGDQTRCGRW
ncbi:hypothetical protein ACJZ2D_012539 [Fusarium nematophilum]